MAIIIATIVVWLSIGIITTISMYNTFRKEWYDKFKKDYKDHPDSILRDIKMYSPIFAMGGLLTLIFHLMFSKNIVIFWKYPVNKK